MATKKKEKKIVPKIQKLRMADESKMEILRIGKTTEFWHLIEEAMQESKDFIQEQMDAEELKELSPELYKLTNELFKAKKQFLSVLINTPDNLISWLGTPDNERKDFVPYER